MINSTINNTTKIILFTANYRFDLIISKLINREVPESDMVQRKEQELRQLQEQISRDIKFLNLRIKHYYNKDRSEKPDF